MAYHTNPSRLRSRERSWIKLPGESLPSVRQTTSGTQGFLASLELLPLPRLEDIARRVLVFLGLPQR